MDASTTATNTTTTKTLERLKVLREKMKPSVSSEDEEEHLKYISEIAGMELTKELLKESLIGRSMSTLAAKGKEREMKAAKEIVAKWKKEFTSASPDTTAASLSLPSAASTSSSVPDISSPKVEINATVTTAKSEEVGTPREESAEEKPKEQSAVKARKIDVPAFATKDDKRRKTIALLISAFVTDPESDYPDSQIQRICVDVEAQIQKITGADVDLYKEKLRSLKFNLTKNQSLRRNLIFGDISPEKLCAMSVAELASEDKKRDREKMQKEESNRKRSDWLDANRDQINAAAGITSTEGQFKCGRCRSSKTTFYQRQTRSADEPMTVFVTCIDCGHKWKF